MSKGMAGFHENGLMTEVEIGSALGIRAFNVDEKGRLNSVIAPHIWKPGINTAEAMIDVTGSSPYGMRDRRFAKAGAESGVETHGFYSYHNGHDEFEHSSRVTGIVRNTGDVRIGEHGFRSEHAEIVAVVIPQRQPLKTLSWLEKFTASHIVKITYDSYRGKSTKDFSFGFSMFFWCSVTLGLGLFLPLGLTVSPWFFLTFVPVVAALGLGWGALRTAKKLIVNAEMLRLNRGVPDFSRVKYSYGDNIKYFSTRAEMLKAFPLYQVPKPPEPTPADESYWT